MTKVLLLGIGNLLWADEGFGVRVIETLLKNYSFPENITVLDGGTQGVYLVQHVQESDVLIVFDAIDFDLPAGSLKLIHNEDVPNFMGAKKMSLHQTGFQEVLAMAQLLGDYPQHLLLIGVQPVELDDYGGSLRPQVKAQIQPAIDCALQYLAQFTLYPQPLEANASVTLSDPMLDMQRYETQRPSELEACRLGDERVVYSPHVKIIAPESSEGAIPIDVDFRGQY
ncbi:MAG: HyaD/HybD family hydrogenase maturation endopeptidase [Methylococcaceae bacterium]